MGSLEGKFTQVKAHWTPENHELFIDLCLEQISLGTRPRTHFTTKGWKNLMDSFYSITGLKYDRIQLKNHWDITKKNWNIWHKLISTDGLKWDPATQSFGASEEEWGEYLRANPEAAQFRHKELLFADKLDIVFGGTSDSGVRERPPPGKRINCFTGAEPATRHRKHNYAAEKEPPACTGKQQYRWTNTLLPVAEPIGARPDSNIERCYDAVESMSAITVQSPPLKFCYSIEECIKCLDSIEELEQGSELYLFALDIFLKKEYREIFLNLKKPSTRIAWLERLLSIGPSL
ncbi:UNVERIFIED_CONTAM: L10-interacting MYB domain-containing protein [Sesamum latifolium]|uniref:L10-interacting MYB domain-containing protein n=1 Tax=Sesamum latifolium TaxID=2727402 RepID=A0AAW2XIU5_9LAMI